MTDVLQGWDGLFGSALTLGADQSYITDKTANSVSTNALDSMTPVRQETTDDAFGWLKDLAKSGVGYLIQKDAQQNKVVPAPVYAKTAEQMQGQQVQQSAQGGGMLMLLVVVSVVALVLKD